MAQTDVIPLDTVLRNALQVYQLQLSNWGNTGASKDARSIASKALSFPLAGVAIDPDSTVDRCILRPTTTTGVDDSGAEKDEDIPLSKGLILSGRFGFPRIRNFDGGFAVICPDNDRWGDTANSLGGATMPFGGNVTPGVVFEKAELRLLMFTDANLPGISIPPRANLRRRVDAVLPGPPGTYYPIAYYPVSGRKRLRVICFPDSGVGAGHMRLTGLMLNAYAGGLAQEFQLSDTALTGGTPCAPPPVDPLLCQYLGIYMQGTPAGQVHIAVDVED